MGCASSKEKHSKCRERERRLGVSRRYSMLVHHPPSKAGDSYHVVALTSSTLGSLTFDTSCPRPHYTTFNGRLPLQKISSKVVDRREAKAWSKMIDEKIKVRKAVDTPETINAWEMMEDLEEDCGEEESGLEEGREESGLGDGREESGLDKGIEESGLEEGIEGSDCGKESALEEESDGQVMWALRKAFGELSPSNPFRLSNLKANGALEVHLPLGDGTNLNVSIDKDKSKDDDSDCCDDSDKEKLVLYLTSLRGIRKTYEDCCDVKLILKGLGVKVDERDVSMHSAFKDELRHRLLLSGKDNDSGLPQVFVGDTYIGGADDIRRMDEDGCLRKAFRRCDFRQDQPCCDACGDIRFIPCEACSGSCKLYYQVEDEVDEADFGFQRCPRCNENGLIRCPICSSW